MKKRIITYEEYGKLVRTLSTSIRVSKLSAGIKTISGITKSGVTIAIHLSNHLKLEYVHNPVIGGNGNLLVFGIIDTGEELRDQKANGYLTAALFYKNAAIIKPNFSVERLYYKKTEIIFPWEVEEKKY